MKLKLLTLLRLFLKRSLKRNKIDRCIFLSVCLFLSGFVSLNAITADLKVDYSEKPIIFCKIADADEVHLMESLQKGYTSEVQIEILLYKKRKMPYSLFGDILIEDFEFIRSAEKDLFSELLLVKDSDKETYYIKTSVFFNNFLSYEIQFPGELLNRYDLDNYYFKIKTSLIYNLYIQPFNIFYLLNHKDRSTTGWIIREIEQVSK